jgi:hypothetical protein
MSFGFVIKILFIDFMDELGVFTDEKCRILNNFCHRLDSDLEFSPLLVINIFSPTLKIMFHFSIFG